MTQFARKIPISHARPKFRLNHHSQPRPTLTQKALQAWQKAVALLRHK